ncbi:MAG: L-seryl-tRNA(Sec) selenium transferase [Clostridiales bacterium]|jgi:L-seryl-tRNA(Ser) seleniumtransferase|nr:L-seryl-tRNA(Sec) selenium transferase [Clostridiales bacterium]
MNSIDVLRLLPSVDQMLRKPEVKDMMERHARATVTEALRRVLQETRQRIMEGGYNDEISAGTIEGELVRVLDERLKKESRGNLREVINGTGVVIHTNLGRSPMADRAVADLARLSGVYVNLEYDLQSGERGSRHDIVRELLRSITGAEDCIVVNNNAAAVLLVLSAMASGKEVIVSRGELVEIGGSFRVPEVMEQGGARLVEVGATNKTYIEDYRKAINENTGLLLKVHTSNYRICGFTRQVSREELAALGREFGIPAVEDLGSGMFVDLGEYGIGDEPTVQDSIRSGMDIVTFSGDKLLGGPQAGIIAGRKEYIRKIAKHPLARAVRVDRLTLSVLESTLRIYAESERVVERIPVLSMLTMPVDRLERRAERLVELLAGIEPYAEIAVETEYSQVGGGSLPLERIETRVISVLPKSMTLNQLEEGLRMADTPVIGRIARDRFLIDVRTVFDHQLPVLAKMLRLVLSGGGDR